MSSMFHIYEKLMNFWKTQNTLLKVSRLLPIDNVVGAATFHATCFFSCLQLEKFSYVYAQPSTRKADGRYGKSQNRLFTHNQLQYITSPAPANVRELYLKSLEYIGFDLKKHDLKFIDNNWNNPSIGARGVGWEVVMDGMEITQFTYFTHMADIELHNSPVELAYGMERLCVMLNNQSIWSCDYDEGVTYKDIFYEREKQMCTYYNDYNQFGINHLNESLHFIQLPIEKELWYPAYIHLLNSMAIFDSLDAKKSFGQMERKKYIEIFSEYSNKIGILCRK